MCVTNECHLRDENIHTDNGLGLAVAQRKMNLPNEFISETVANSLRLPFSHNAPAIMHLFGAQL